MYFILANSLVEKLNQAIDGKEKQEKIFNSLTEITNPEMLEVWSLQAALAETNRGDALRVYDVKFESGEYMLAKNHMIHYAKQTFSSHYCRNKVVYG